MRTVLNRSAGRASFILVSARMVGSVAFPAVPAVQARRKYGAGCSGMP
jgi:hypothetical protein